MLIPDLRVLNYVFAYDLIFLNWSIVCHYRCRRTCRHRSGMREWAFLFSFPFPTNKRDDHLTDALAVRTGRMPLLHPAHQRRTMVGLLLVCALPRSAARYRCWHHFRPHKMQRALPRTHALNCSGTTRLPFFLPWLLFGQLEINWFYTRIRKNFSLLLVGQLEINLFFAVFWLKSL